MRKIFLLFVIPAILAAPASAAGGELKLTIQNGLVTLDADDVPLSMIMAEWARIGQTKIVNGEKMMTRVSLNLVDVPERRALDVLLRTASGFMAAERRTAVAGASVFDSIMILPTSTPPANRPIASPVPTFVPRPMPQPQPQLEPDEDPGMPPGAEVQPVPSGQPGMPGQNPAAPNAPLTAPRPGQLPPPPPQQPVPFGTQRPPGTGPGGAPVKPGGGGGPGGGVQPGV